MLRACRVDETLAIAGITLPARIRISNTGAVCRT
jgi:hypothetical protein